MLSGSHFDESGLSKICFDVQQIKRQKRNQKEERENVKKTFLFTNMFAVILSVGMWGCQNTAVGPSTASQKENLLLRSGFTTKTVTTPKQQQRVSALPAGKVSTVGYKGKLYYVYPTATKDRILVGNQTQYNAYKQAVVAYGVTTSPDFVEETHGPHRILIRQFDGFGPLGE
jgi:hypothetical protein